MSKYKEDERERAIHYLEVLKLNSVAYQIEIRNALDYAIKELKKCANCEYNHNCN